MFAFCYYGGFVHCAVGGERDAGSGRVEVVSGVGFLCGVDEDVGEGDVCSVKGLTKVAVPVEEIFEVENGGVAHRVASEGFDEFGVAAVDRLEGLTLMLDGRPCIS